MHRCRFVPLTPSAITALAFSPFSPTLAVGRSNGDIQLYHTASATATTTGPLHYKTLPGTGEATVQALLWVRGGGGGGERLLSAGLNGRLVEWDLTRLTPRHATDSYGGAVWAASLLDGHSMAAQVAAGGISAGEADLEHASSVVLACEDGTLRLFDTSDPTSPPTYIKSLARHAGRALSVAWYDPVTVVSGGSDGSLRVWDVPSGRNTSRIAVGGDGVNVWSVACVQGRIVSGDSVGAISVWDYHYGTLLQRLLHHKADVLSLSVTPDGAAIYSASVDATVSQCQRLPTGQYVMAAPLRGPHARCERGERRWGWAGGWRAAGRIRCWWCGVWVRPRLSSCCRSRTGAPLAWRMACSWCGRTSGSACISCPTCTPRPS